MPIYRVDTAPFKLLVRRRTAGRLGTRCGKTLTSQLESRFKQRKQNLIDTLKTIDRLCTTADCRTGRRRSFLGITIHRLNKDTLQRHSACLAVKQVFGRHTFDVLARFLSAINDEFRIIDKTCFTVTDNGSNFVKVFRYVDVT